MLSLHPAVLQGMSPEDADGCFGCGGIAEFAAHLPCGLWVKVPAVREGCPRDLERMNTFYLKSR